MNDPLVMVMRCVVDSVFPGVGVGTCGTFGDRHLFLCPAKVVHSNVNHFEKLGEYDNATCTSCMSEGAVTAEGVVCTGNGDPEKMSHMSRPLVKMGMHHHIIHDDFVTCYASSVDVVGVFVDKSARFEFGCDRQC